MVGQLPLQDLLNLYSLLCTWLAETFAAGPVDLGPEFEVRAEGAQTSATLQFHSCDLQPAGVWVLRSQHSRTCGVRTTLQVLWMHLPGAYNIAFT